MIHTLSLQESRPPDVKITLNNECRASSTVSLSYDGKTTRQWPWIVFGIGFVFCTEVTKTSIIREMAAS